jgi:hypothetical protein
MLLRLRGLLLIVSSTTARVSSTTARVAAVELEELSATLAKIIETTPTTSDSTDNARGIMCTFF